MHFTTRISDSSDLIRIVFAPPIQRCNNVHSYVNHTHKFSMVCSCLNQSFHQIKVIFTDSAAMIDGCAAAVYIVTRHFFFCCYKTIGFVPAIPRISHSTDGCLPAVNINVFNFNHYNLSFLSTPRTCLDAISP